VRRLEPAEAIWLAVVPAMLTTSALLIERDQAPLTDVARRHPFITAYIGLHLIGVLPPALDAISIGHAVYVRKRSRGRGRADALVAGVQAAGS
jgi:hypothetical protein